MRKRITILFLLGLAIGALAPRAYALVLPADHLKCYKVKDPAAKVKYTADLTPTYLGFPLDTGCTIKVPAKMLCTSVFKSNVNPTPPNANGFAQSFDQLFVCYKLKCPKIDLQRNFSDQFANRPATLSSSKLLCTPAWSADDTMQ